MFIDKGGILALSKKGKIILLVSVVVAIGIFLAVFFSQKKQQDLATEPTAVPGESAVVLERIYENPNQLSSRTPGPSATASTAALATASPSPTRTVIIGMFDYSQNATSSNSAFDKLIEKNEQMLEKNNVCKLAGFSDSWSNPVDKTVCGTIKFSLDQVLEPLNRILCNLTASAWAVNYDDNINVNYNDGSCLIKDRK